MANQELDPNVALSDTLSNMLYGGNPRFLGSLKADMVDKIDYDNVLKIYKDRFDNPGDFTFIFVGNLDGANVRDLIAKYIGGLKTDKAREKYNEKNVMEVNKGLDERSFNREMETPKATVLEFYIGDYKYTLKHDLEVNIIGQLLDMCYTESIRENIGGSYGVGVSGTMNDLPKGKFFFQICFDTDPAKLDTTLIAVKDGIDKFIAEGPNAEDLAKVKEYMVKKHHEDVKENSYWMNAIYNYVLTGRDDSTAYLETLESIDAKSLVKTAKAVFAEKNKKQLIMMGE